MGGTRFHEATEFSFGGEYELRAWNRVGLGVLGERTPAAHHDDGVNVFLEAVHLDPCGGLRITAGAGVGAPGGEHSENHGLFRTGVVWDLPLGSQFALAPTLVFDFVDGGTASVFGAAFLAHF